MDKFILDDSPCMGIVVARKTAEERLSTLTKYLLDPNKKPERQFSCAGIKVAVMIGAARVSKLTSFLIQEGEERQRKLRAMG